jgi:hypothetical protein
VIGAIEDSDQRILSGIVRRNAVATAWTAETDYPAANLHVGIAAPVDSDGAEVRSPGTETAPSVTGWKAICACGWASERIYPRSEFPSPDGLPPPLVEGYEDLTMAFAEWNDHFTRAVPELQVYELAKKLGAVRDLFNTAVHDAQAVGVSRSLIASVVEQAAGGRIAFFPDGGRGARGPRSNRFSSGHRPSPPRRDGPTLGGS